MKRTTLTAALTGAALLLAGCSSSSTATPSSSSSSSSSAPVATPSAAVSSSAPSSASSSGTSSSESSSSAPVSTESSASSSAPVSSVTSGATGASGAPTTTVGDTTTGLDVQTAAWFSTFCTGFEPIVGLSKSAAGLATSSSDPTKGKEQLVDLYSKFGTSFTTTAAKLKPLPPPSFAGGPAFAAKVVKALESAGPVFTADADKLKAVNVGKDPAAFGKAVESLSTNLTTATQPLQDLGSLKLTPQTQAAFEKLPACAKLQASATG